MKNIINIDKKSDLEYFFEISVDLMAIIGKDNKVKKVNNCCSDVLGWSETELLLYEWSFFVYEDDISKVIKCMRDKNTVNGIRGLEVRFKCKNGDFRWIECNCKYIEEKEVYIMTARDITEAKLIREEKIAYEKAIELESIKSEFFSNISHE